MPISAINAFSAMMSRAKKRITLTVRSPTLAMQTSPKEFFNDISNMKNLASLDLTSWYNLSARELAPLSHLTNLQLAVSYSNTTIRPLTISISRLELLNRVSGFYLLPLPNLLDLTVDSIYNRQVFQQASNWTALTRLSIICTYWYGDAPEIDLTALPNLRDLRFVNKYSYQSGGISKLIASCTTLESFEIDAISMEEVDIDWISLNTRLTKFYFKSAINGAVDITRYNPLTALQNITSVQFFNEGIARLFGHCNLKALHLTFQISKEFEQMMVNQWQLLESLKRTDYNSSISLLSNLTQLNCYSASGTFLPTSLKILVSSGECQNINQLTNLESIKYTNLTQPRLYFKPRNFSNLTRMDMTIGSETALLTPLMLINATTLRELYITTSRQEHWRPTEFVFDPDFVTELTNLEVLSIPSFNIAMPEFDNITLRNTKLTQLHIVSNESSGYNIVKLTNLQVLTFSSARTMKGLKQFLEQKLPRLYEITLNPYVIK